MPGTTRDALLCQREAVLATLRANLAAAQERMKVQADKQRQERSFEVGDCIYLKLQPYRQRTLAYKGKWKLSPRYFGPFQVLQKVWIMSYKLDLPCEAKLHPVFHVSGLKLKLGQQVHPIPTLPPVDGEGQVFAKPIKVLQTKSRILRSREITEVLVLVVWLFLR